MGTAKSRVVTTVRKRGRRVSVIDVELNQGDRTAVRAAVTLGDPEHHVPPLLSVNPVIPLMQPEPPPGLEPIGPGHPMEDVVHLARGCDIRPSLTTFNPRTDGGPPIIEYWVRPKGVAPDVLFALLCGDVSAPVTFSQAALGAPLEVPTLEGKYVTHNLKRGTQSGDEVRLSGKGMPRLHGGRHGDLVLHIQVVTPRNLTKRQEELLRELGEIEGKNVSPERKSFLDRVRDFFTPDSSSTGAAT